MEEEERGREGGKKGKRCNIGFNGKRAVLTLHLALLTLVAFFNAFFREV